jgi:hypothetical protein
MNRRRIAVFLVSLIVSCSVWTGIVVATDEQVRNQPSRNNQDHFLLFLSVYTYEKVWEEKGKPNYYERIVEGNCTVELYSSQTNQLIEPSYYVGNITVWNLTMDEYYDLFISKKGYISQRWYGITDIGNMWQNPIHTVLLKKSAPLFLRLLGKRINNRIFNIISIIFYYLPWIYFPNERAFLKISS